MNLHELPPITDVQRAVVPYLQRLHTSHAALLAAAKDAEMLIKNLIDDDEPYLGSEFERKCLAQLKATISLAEENVP